MSIHQIIKTLLEPMAKGIRVEEVRIGLRYTAVLLENDQTGVAFTFNNVMTRGWRIFPDLYPLAGRQASELIPFLDSKDRIESAVALATVNALSNRQKDDLIEGDILDHISIGHRDRVGMVGYFAPMVPRLRKKTASLMIFEQIDQRQGDLLPEKDAYRFLPDCHVAMITSTAILNHTIEDLLNAAHSCREVVLLGASTPLLPAAFSGTPATMLSGVVITRPGGVLRIVSEGGGMHLFKNQVRKVNLPLKKRGDRSPVSGGR